MSDLGIIVVSHSSSLAQGIADLVNEVAKDVPFAYVGGLEDGSIGTSFEQIMEV